MRFECYSLWLSLQATVPKFLATLIRQAHAAILIRNPRALAIMMTAGTGLELPLAGQDLAICERDSFIFATLNSHASNTNRFSFWIFGQPLSLGHNVNLEWSMISYHRFTSVLSARWRFQDDKNKLQSKIHGDQLLQSLIEVCYYITQWLMTWSHILYSTELFKRVTCK